MEEIDVFRARLLRHEVNQSWGFQLQGGAEVNQPIKISKIAAHSPAETTGLKVDDELTEVRETSTFNLSHSQVLEIIRQQTGESLLLTIERKSVGSTSVGRETGSDVIDPILSKEREPIGRTGSQEKNRPTDAELRKERSQVSSSTIHPTDTYNAETELKRRGETFYSGNIENRPPNENRFQPNMTPSYPAPTNISGPLRYSPGPQKTPFQFQTARSRPFVDPPTRRPRPAAVASPTQPAPSSPATRPYIHPVDTEPDFGSLSSQYKSDYSAYLRDDDPTADVIQSRTFRMLESVMSNDEPGAGVAALPPPRSAVMERMKRNGSFGSSPRVKVLMSQKYNSPMGMYSANNVIETFAVQAETALETLEKSSSYG